MGIYTYRLWLPSLSFLILFLSRVGSVTKVNSVRVYVNDENIHRIQKDHPRPDDLSEGSNDS